MTNWTVKTSKSYPVFVGENWDSFCVPHEKVCVVTDDVVAPLYLHEVSKKLKNVYPFVIPNGESSKNTQNYLQILSYLAQNNFHRNDAIVALGGGVVGDLAGFVASTYQRGISFYQVPTTLMAMVDSCLGGKTAVNLAEGKNLAGTFYQPDGVFVNVSTLQTLPQRQLNNGYAEIAKYAFLSSKIAHVWQNCDQIQLIVECLKYKTAIVEQDERESGLRALLNLGHTVGHAIEALSNYSLLHGECVAKGLGVALDVSQKFFSLPAETVNRCKSILGNRFDLSLPFTTRQILQKIVCDKKCFGDNLKFVMIHDVGDCRVENITFSELEKLL